MLLIADSVSVRALTALQILAQVEKQKTNEIIRPNHIILVTLQSLRSLKREGRGLEA